MASQSTSTDMGASAKSVFTRSASGLVRQFSLRDMAVFGFLATGGIYSFIYFFPFPEALSPGFSVTVALILTFLFAIPVWFVYAGVGSAMPRGGGDYVYQSRTIHPLVGFMNAWAIQLIGWLFIVTGSAFAINSLGLVPLLDLAGFHSAAAWLLTPTGSFAVAIVFVFLSWGLSVYGLGLYRRVQTYVLIPCISAALIAIVVVLVANLGTDFTAAFNAYHAGTGITMASLHGAAVEAGYRQVPFSFRNTIIWVAVFGGLIPYTMFPAQGILGEVKDASNFGRLFKAFMIPGAIATFIMLLLPWLLLQSIAGNTFLNEYAAAYVGGTISPSYSPNINVFVAMLTHNNSAVTSVVTILVSLGFIAGGFGFGSTLFVNAPRIMLAMSLDGVLPASLSKVSNRTFTPVRAITVWSIGAAGVVAWFCYLPDSTLAFLSAGMVLVVGMIVFTGLGAALFPYTAPGIYASAPVARHKILGIPLITVTGVLSAVLAAFCVYWALAEPALGVSGMWPRLLVVAMYASGAIAYFVWRRLRIAQGIDVSLAAREVPPE